MLNDTDVPLFFLFTQLLIAVFLFLAAHAAGLLQVPFDFSPQLIKGLLPTVCLNVVGLRYAFYCILTCFQTSHSALL